MSDLVNKLKKAIEGIQRAELDATACCMKEGCISSYHLNRIDKSIFELECVYRQIEELELIASLAGKRL